MTGRLPALPDAVTVRAARDSDVDRVLEIHLTSFPDPRPLEVRRRVFHQNRLGGLHNLRLAERGGEVVGHAFAFPVGVFWGGREVAASAVASVGVALESRGTGVATALLSAIHAESRARGEACTLLYPFRQGFYARAGYAPVSPRRVFALSPRAIPDTWRGATRGTVRRARGADRAEIARIYVESARLGTGFLARPDRAWEHDILDERRQWLVLDDGGRLGGYLSLRLHQTEANARVRAEVYELVAPDDAARRCLLASLATLGDQVNEITLSMAEDDPLDWAFVDADRDRAGTEEVEHACGVVSAGPMIRLHDAEAALRSRGYTTEGSIDLAIDAAAPFGLEVRAGTARVTPPRGGEEGPLHMSLAVLASVAFGGLSLGAAARLGWLPGSDARAVRRAASIFALPAFFSLDAF